MVPRSLIVRLPALVFTGSFALGCLAPPTLTAESISKLVRCGGESCLQISGQRDNPAAIVRINDHVVPVAGERGWQVRLPIDIVRQLSAPFARTIEVSMQDPQTQVETTEHVDLPIGLLGFATELASLEVSAR